MRKHCIALNGTLLTSNVQNYTLQPNRYSHLKVMNGSTSTAIGYIVNMYLFITTPLLTRTFGSKDCEVVISKVKKKYSTPICLAQSCTKLLISQLTMSETIKLNRAKQEQAVYLPIFKVKCFLGGK